MSRRPRGPRPGLVVATLLTAALALAGCSAGTVTQTDTVVSQAAGAFAQVGPIALRDVALDPGPGGTVPSGGQIAVRGTLVNEGAAPDRLVAVSTPYAVSVRLEGATDVPNGTAVRLVGADPVPVGPANPDTRQSATARATLTGVTQQMRPGPTYAITFTFERAGSVTVPVIVVGPAVAHSG